MFFSLVLQPGPSELDRLLKKRDITSVDFEDWEKIDQAESAAGKLRGKPREKLTQTIQLLKATK